jgi:hypothetical protein
MNAIKDVFRMLDIFARRDSQGKVEFARCSHLLEPSVETLAPRSVLESLFPFIMAGLHGRAFTECRCSVSFIRPH